MVIRHSVAVHILVYPLQWKCQRYLRIIYMIYLYSHSILLHIPLVYANTPFMFWFVFTWIFNQVKLKGCAIAQADSRLFPTSAARVSAQIRSYGICGGQRGSGDTFPPNTAVSIATYSVDCSTIIIIHHPLSIILRWYNRPNRRHTYQLDSDSSHPKIYIYIYREREREREREKLNSKLSIWAVGSRDSPSNLYFYSILFLFPYSSFYRVTYSPGYCFCVSSVTENECRVASKI
jgi:hypothetical protein